MWTDEEIKGKILHKLMRLGKFKASHTSIDNLPKGFPKDIRGRVKGIADEMVKEGFFFVKPTNYGKEVSINLEKKDEILRLIEIFLRKK